LEMAGKCCATVPGDGVGCGGERPGARSGCDSTALVIGCFSAESTPPSVLVDWFVAVAVSDSGWSNPLDVVGVMGLVGWLDEEGS
jgi:hypothetical protein